MFSRRADVFFYGLFMDAAVLRAKGVMPATSELAWLDGFTLRIGQRAVLVPEQRGRVYGLLMSVTLDDLQRLYSEPSLGSYKAQAVLIEVASGGVLAALCYNLPDPTSAGERNPEYAA